MTQGLGFENRRIARLYRGVPDEQVARLLQFRTAHPYRRVTIDGGDWEYIDAGRGSMVILLLPGALGLAESSWQTIVHLAARPGIRVISPSYAPTVTTVAEMIDGIAGILDHEGVSLARVMGGSAGGYFAQVFVRRYRDRTERLVISHAGPPDPEQGSKLSGSLCWLRLVPEGMMRALFRKRMEGLLAEGRAETALVRAHMSEIASFRLTKEGLMNLYRCLADFHLHHVFSPQDLAAWGGDVQLILADDDPATPLSVREEMTRLYPQARVHLFHGTGHTASLLRQEEYFAVLDGFIAAGP